MVLLSWGKGIMELIIFGAVVAISIIYSKDSEGFVSLFGIGLKEAVRVFDNESIDCIRSKTHFDKD